ncbi:MAG: hypothetical protein PHH49_02415 [Candidatus Omnitrophica bacterium]|nr:hypothetical protein [Candidatus Omnitrophota bacterium]MDD5487801.1 hypothetical protein [Candidatus Omnitrophota bacterium]
MLTRQQILLPDWLVEHYKTVAAKYNMSFSEMVRLAMCMHLGNIFPELHPGYNCDIDSKKLASAFKELAASEEGREQFDAMVSHIYLEAKKAVNFRKETLKTGSGKKGPGSRKKKI